MRPFAYISKHRLVLDSHSVRQYNANVLSRCCTEIVPYCVSSGLRVKCLLKTPPYYDLPGLLFLLCTRWLVRAESSACQSFSELGGELLHEKASELKKWY
ncbi:hypothetical protein M758_12G079300 [Ceratodon purpureus]|uniref:Uncharacterized protein n=1 Tax=Ceratodon purpureus TaxID=3225 RepID=A0A8T0GAE3_CERPU|nr:hypothetical protein KC19_12G076900 [Ceratodon purpureus]KAG0598497.1 hypothetical protein M758_12G079300 [Ceratodon purpureus]